MPTAMGSSTTTKGTRPEFVTEAMAAMASFGVIDSAPDFVVHFLCVRQKSEVD